MSIALRILRFILCIPSFFVIAGLTNFILGHFFSWWNVGTTLDNGGDHLPGNFFQSLIINAIGLFTVSFVFPNENKKPILFIMLGVNILLITVFVVILSNSFPQIKNELKSPAFSIWNIATGIIGAIVAFFAVWQSVIRNSEIFKIFVEPQ